MDFTVATIKRTKKTREEEFFDFFKRELGRQDDAITLPRISAYKIDKEATLVFVDEIAINNNHFEVKINGRFIPFNYFLENYYIEGFNNKECFKTKNYKNVKAFF